MPPPKPRQYRNSPPYLEPNGKCTRSRRLNRPKTSLGRNVQPLERDGLIAIEPDPQDRRSRVLRLTRTGANRFERAHKGWAEAHRRFEDAYGGNRAAEL